MAGAKETPRQKLIALMYLVFITMLALNVSKEVLDGFGQMFKKIASANDRVDQSNDIYYNKIEVNAKEKEGKWIDNNRIAVEIKKEAVAPVLPQATSVVIPQAVDAAPVAPQAPAAAPAEEAPKEEDNFTEIKAQMVGTFYTSSSPDNDNIDFNKFDRIYSKPTHFITLNNRSNNKEKKNVLQFSKDLSYLPIFGNNIIQRYTKFISRSSSRYFTMS